MTTALSPQKQAANRRNATHSTGPRTPEGKAIVSKNATKHGLTARDVVGADESHEAFKAFAASLTEQLAPVGAVENMLAERVTHCVWRLRRAVRLEAMALSVPSRFKSDDGEPPLLDSFQRWQGMMEVFGRYERTHEAAMLRALHELQRLQATRGGAHGFVPLVLDVVTTDGQGERSSKETGGELD